MRRLTLVAVVVGLGGLAGCDESKPRPPERKSIATASGKPGGLEVPALGVRIDLPADSKIAPADADGKVVVKSSATTVDLSVMTSGMTYADGMSIAKSQGWKILATEEGDDGSYLLHSSTPPEVFYSASVMLLIGDRTIYCYSASRDEAATRAGLDACRSLRAL